VGSERQRCIPCLLVSLSVGSGNNSVCALLYRTMVLEDRVKRIAEERSNAREERQAEGGIQLCLVPHTFRLQLLPLDCSQLAVAHQSCHTEAPTPLFATFLASSAGRRASLSTNSSAAMASQQDRGAVDQSRKYWTSGPPSTPLQQPR
jgi:hypothetical protein